MAAPAKTLSYPEAVERLLKLGLEGRSLKWDLESVRRMLERLGRPDRGTASVHIAGTNGKGSVGAMTARVLREAGIRAGLYTSPHLRRINERVAVEGQPIDDEEFAAAYVKIEAVFEALIEEGALPHNPSYFETLTAMALEHFARSGVEVAVLEVGLGGRLDATSAVTPAVGVITSIDFDHERWLGHSIEAIAAEKAGILKPGVPVVNAAEHPQALRVIARRAGETGSPLIDPAGISLTVEGATDLGRSVVRAEWVDGSEIRCTLGLRGSHQVRNARTAIAACGELSRQGWPIPADAVARGLEKTEWPGRLQLLEPGGAPVLLDGAHNPAAARRLAEFLDEHLGERTVHLIYGTLREKAVEEIAEALFPRAATVVLTQPLSPRAASVKTLAVLTEGMNPDIDLIPDPEQALRRVQARARSQDIILAAGSLYLMGDCLRALDSAAAGVAAAAAATAQPEPLP